jgi:hypothetical protein
LGAEEAIKNNAKNEKWNGYNTRNKHAKKCGGVEGS